MTATKAASVASALITAGFPCSALQVTPGEWVIKSRTTDGFTVDVNVVSSFVAAQTVNGKVAEVEYS